MAEKNNIYLLLRFKTEISMELKAAASDGMLLYAAQRANQVIYLIIKKKKKIWQKIFIIKINFR